MKITYPGQMIAGVLVAGSLVSCASGPSIETAGAASSANPSQPPYQVKPLNGLQTFEDGAVRLTPPPTGDAPKVSAADAFATFIKINVYVDKVSDRTAAMYAARLTSYAKSNRVDPDTGALVPDTENEPVWVIEYTGVPDQAIGPGQPSGASTRSAPENFLQDIVMLVDSDTGHALTLLSVPPEDPPSPVPTADPAGKPSG